jgi:hypothetical protein
LFLCLINSNQSSRSEKVDSCAVASVVVVIVEEEEDLGLICESAEGEEARAGGKNTCQNEMAIARNEEQHPVGPD